MNDLTTTADLPLVLTCPICDELDSELVDVPDRNVYGILYHPITGGIACSPMPTVRLFRRHFLHMKTWHREAFIDMLDMLGAKDDIGTEDG